VISDDLALPFGSIRLRPKGTHGGQNGLRNIIDRLRTNEFIRLRMGIMPEHPIANAKNFVLENFSKGETETVNEVLEKAADAVRAVISDGTERAMARFN
jgi:PTH1 family peptidyl-tRNA hydrolase